MDSVGPQRSSHLPQKRRVSPEVHDDHAPLKRSRSVSSNEDEGKKRRIIGPAAPPANLSQQPLTEITSIDAGSDETSSEDDLGPSLPPVPGSQSQIEEAQSQQVLLDQLEAQKAASKPQREEWMLVPPKQDDLSARADPTKIKNRKFNTGKASQTPSQNHGGNNALWTETPEQKRQRLEDEVMGVKKPAQLGSDEKQFPAKDEENRATQRRIREYNEKNRKETLMSEHKKAVPKEKEDDPSQRAFDREKDIGLGVKIGHKAKGEMVAKAKDFGGRFAGGSYL